MHIPSVNKVKLQFLLLLFFSLFCLCSEVQATECTYNSSQVSLPPIVGFATGDGSGKIISKNWHEVFTPIALDCVTSPTAKESLQSIIRSTATDTGKRITFEGKSYIAYATGHPKIGVIAEVGDVTPYTPLTSSFQVIAEVVRASGTRFTLGSKVRVRLVALDYLPPGSYVLSGIPNLSWHGVRNKVTQTYIGAGVVSVSGSNVLVENKACELKTPGTVILPKIDMSRISYSQGVDFNMTLICAGAGYPFMVSYEMSDVGNLKNSTSILTPGGGAGMAKGIALKIYDDSKEVSLSPPASLINVRTFGNIPEEGGTVTKNMKVRYVTTTATALPGRVTGGVTITLSYK